LSADTNLNLYFNLFFQFDFGEGAVSRFMLWHCGIDAWGFEWIRIVFDDESFVQCGPRGGIDDEKFLSLTCA
jgi:hypothetical protein